MKLSEIARYWAARELTRLNRVGNRLILESPFAVKLTFRIAKVKGQRDSIGNLRRSLKYPVWLRGRGGR